MEDLEEPRDNTLVDTLEIITEFIANTKESLVNDNCMLDPSTKIRMENALAQAYETMFMLMKLLEGSYRNIYEEEHHGDADHS